MCEKTRILAQVFLHCIEIVKKKFRWPKSNLILENMSLKCKLGIVSVWIIIIRKRIQIPTYMYLGVSQMKELCIAYIWKMHWGVLFCNLDNGISLSLNFNYLKGYLQCCSIFLRLVEFITSIRSKSILYFFSLYLSL